MKPAILLATTTIILVVTGLVVTFNAAQLGLIQETVALIWLGLVELVSISFGAYVFLQNDLRKELINLTLM